MKKNNQVPDWNREKSWDKIEQRLEKKKRRFIPFWWIFGGSAVVALIVGIFIFGLRDNESVDQLISESGKQEINVGNINQEISIDDKTIEQKNEIALNDPEDAKDRSLSETTNRSLSETTNRSLSETTNRSLSEAEGNSTKNRSLLLFPSAPLREHHTEHQSTSLGERHSDSAIRSVQSKLESIPFLDFEKAELYYKNEASKLPNQLLVEAPVFNKKNQSKSNQWLWFIESGFDIGNVNHIGENDYANRKSTTEIFRFTSTSTLGFEKELSKNWYLKSGITFQTIFKKYDANAISTDVEDVFRDSAFVYILNDGQAYYEPGLVSETVTYNRQIVKNNFLYRLSLPISFGRKFNFGKIQLAADLGIKPQFYQHFYGIVSDEDNLHVFDNQTINSTYYKNDFDLGLLANLSARYALTASSQIGLGLRYEKEDFLNLRKEAFMSRYEMIGGYFGVYQRF